MDITWFAEIKWGYLRTRKQQIIRRKPDDVRLLFLEPYVRGGANRYAIRQEDDIFVATVPFIKSAPGGPARWVLDRRWARGLVDANARSYVRKSIYDAGFDPFSTGFVLSNVYAIGVATSLPRKFLVYDCNDDHTAFPGQPVWTRDYYARTAQSADSVFATSRSLLNDVRKIRGSSDGSELLGNGVDFAHFDAVRRQHVREPIPKPVLGYIGAIAPWFDFDTVRELAEKRPDWQVVLIGPVMLGAEPDAAVLGRLPNVTVREPVPYDDVPHELMKFTCGLIPFRYDDLTRGVNPNKMYEYLATGLPVVTTAFSDEVRHFSGVVKVAEDTRAFIARCDEVVELSRDPIGIKMVRESAVEAASRHDWAAVADRFWARVRELD